MAAVIYTSQDILNIDVQKYNASLTRIYQEQGGRLIQFCRTDVAEGNGRAFYFDAILPSNRPKKNIPDKGPTPDTPVGFQRTILIPIPYLDGHLFSEQEFARIAADPKPLVVENDVRAMMRQVDEDIMASAIGTAYRGEAGTSTVGFPATNIVPCTTGFGTTANTAGNANPGQLLLAGQILDEMHVPDGPEYRHAIVHPSWVRGMLQAEVVGSFLYNSLRPLEEGQIAHYAGFSIMKHPLIPWGTSAGVATGSATDGFALNLIWGHLNMGFHWLMPVTSRAAVSPTENFNIRTSIKSDYGACRIMDQGVLVMPSARTDLSINQI